MGYDIHDINSIDWKNWIPTEEATLCFIRKKGHILLMEKKTGMGKGLINAPGGRIEKGESPLEAAVRETQEEVLLTPLDLEKKAYCIFNLPRVINYWVTSTRLLIILGPWELPRKPILSG
jgi:8-oxo-dGTP pyrophosphatase MutT (NUDIX family)